MSLPVDMEWEIRTTGATTNGGGFEDKNPGTSVDYSQQDAAQLSLSDIATDAAGTGVSSTTGGFTAAMEGNVIYIAGSGGWIKGWYQITGYTDTNNITIDRSAGVSQTAGTGNVGGAWLPNQTDVALFFGSTNKGDYNTCHWEAGTYTGLTGAVSVDANYLRWSGYNTTRGNTPIGTNRPFVNFGTNGAYVSWGGHYGHSRNMRFQCDHTSTSAGQTFYVSGIGHIQINCKVVRTGYNAYGMRFNADWGQAIQCEYRSELGTALQYADEGFAASFCYIHDSTFGVAYSGTGATGAYFNHCIFDTITSNAAQLYYGSKMMNCMFYNIVGTACIQVSSYTHVTNSIFHTCGTAISGAKSNLSDNNIFYNNTNDFSGGILAGEKDLFTDPLLVDPANQDFTLAASSPCFDAGFKVGAEVGLP